jgi:hypothetical protein
LEKTFMTQRFCIPLLATFVFARIAASQIFITEIQRDPQGGESASPGGASHEFIEIVNFGIDTFRIDSLFLSDGVESDAVIPWPDSLPQHRDCILKTSTLAPGGTAIILDPDYPAAISAVPASRLPIRASTLLLRTEDAEVGNGLASDDGIFIYKGTKATIAGIIAYAGDSAFAGSTPVAGKIVLNVPSTVKEGFSVVPRSFLFGKAVYETCVDSLTPGYFELLHGTLFAEYRFGVLDSVGKTFPCTLACIQAGAALQSPSAWRITSSKNASSVTIAEGTLSTRENKGSAVITLPLDSASYSLRLSSGAVSAQWAIDVSTLWTPIMPIKINELFPRGNAGEPEWFELVNSSSMPINVKGWRFGNNENSETLAATDLLLQPGAFLVVTANTALFQARYPAKNRITTPPHWHSLNNYIDTLCLWDPYSRIKERVCYQNSWFLDWQTQSIARISLASEGMSPQSWSLASSPTPGQPNVIKSATFARLEIGPLPFTPNGDGKNDLLSIALDLPPGYSATVMVYGFSGKKERDFGAWPGRALLWDGKQDNGSPAPLGPFFVVAEITSAKGKTTLRQKGVLWR